MKKLLMIALAIVTFSTVQGQTVEAVDFANINKYKSKNKEVMESSNTPDAVFIGNSITEMWFETDPQFFTSNNYVGRGIGGQTTSQFLLRFRGDVLDLNPQVLVINGGINDIAQNAGTYNPEFTFGNIKSMAEIAQANGITVILTSVLPAANIPWNDAIVDVPTKIIELNKNIKEYADNNGITYVDYYSQMVDPSLAMITGYTTDNVHVNGTGYKVMEKLINEAINAALQDE